MSKKNKKAKKALRQQAMKQIKKEQSVSAQEVASQNTETVEEKPEASAETVEVRAHIKKILITVGILVLIIVGIYLLNLKSDFILKFGAWLSNSLNIQV